jgi:stage IV sporulation protein FB
VIEFREPPRTGFEVGWRLFGIRFRIAPSFFVVYGIIIALLSWPRFGRDPTSLSMAIAFNLAGITIAILFISLVQGLVYKSYGLRSTVLLREFISGVYPEAPPPAALQRIVVALAYPAACFLLFALLYYSDQRFAWSKTSAVAGVMYVVLTWIAMFWGIITLLPVFPYPGGQVLVEVLTLISPRGGLAMALVVSIVVGVAYIAYFLAVYFNKIRELEIVEGVDLPANIMVTVFFALSVIQNWQSLQYIRAAHRGYQEPVDDYGDSAPWER